VFDLFAQADTTPERHYGGLGIGLSLARSLAQLHGGNLSASSPGPGQGSTFELRLPLRAMETAAH
jgi:signal transduction histidine kinase